MKKRRFLAMLLCICMMAIAVSQVCIVGDSISGDYSYRLNSDIISVTITGYSGSGGDVVIPDNINGFTVTHIGSHLFFNRSDVTSVTLPDTIVCIGDFAFYNCGISEVVIPENVTSVGKAVFANCQNLMSITVDSKNTEYVSDKQGVLFAKNKTTLVQYPAGRSENEYIVPSSVKSIGRSAFSNCNNLNNVTISDNVLAIDEYAFIDCAMLSSVVMSKNVIIINSGAFAACERLREVIFRGNAPILYEKDTPVFENVSADFTVYYLAGKKGYTTQKWSKYNTDNCVISGESYFKYSISSDDKATITGYSGKAENVVIPEKIEGYPVTAIGEAAFINSNAMKRIVIPNTVTDIGNGAFYSCKSLKSITIPESVKSIGSSVVQWCSNLESATIENGLTEIGKAMFYGCEKLTSVSIPESITTINSHAFYECVNLTSIVIPSNVKAIDFCAFGECKNLKSVYFKGNAPTVTDSMAFYNHDSDLTIYYIKGKSGWTGSEWKDLKLSTYSP